MNTATFIVCIVIFVINFIITTAIVAFDDNIKSSVKVIIITLYVIVISLNSSIVFDYKSFKDNYYPYTKELINAQTHLINITGYILNLEWEECNNNVYDKWCNQEVLQELKNVSDSVHNLGTEYDKFIKDKQNETLNW